MADADQKPPSSDCLRAENYPNPTDSATPSLHEWVSGEIAARGGVPFPEYLDIVLYDKQRGYYAKSQDQVGREGDFYTSVSVGPMFGRLLARRFVKGWDDAGNPHTWRILEKVTRRQTKVLDGRPAQARLRGQHVHQFNNELYSVRT